MELQQQQLKELDKWLTEMEETRLKHEPIGSDLETIKSQVDQHKVSLFLFCNYKKVMIKSCYHFVLCLIEIGNN